MLKRYEVVVLIDGKSDRFEFFAPSVTKAKTYVRNYFYSEGFLDARVVSVKAIS